MLCDKQLVVLVFIHDPAIYLIGSGLSRQE